MDDPERRTPRVDPLKAGVDQGIDQATMLRLLACANRPEARDRRKYEATAWFRGLKRQAVQYFGCCVLCERGRAMDFAGKLRALTVHHRNYRHWFDESLATDVTVICHPCHRKYHAGRR